MVAGDRYALFNKLSSEHVTRQKLTAPHWLATSWALGELVAELDRGPLSRVADFGCRDSLLPGLVNALGIAVNGVDRDPNVSDLQDAAAKRLGMSRNWRVQVGGELDDDVTYDAVTALWAVQHNPPDEQSQIVMHLCERLCPGGVLLVVASYEPVTTRVDEQRADPQVRLCFEDVLTLLVGPVMKRWTGSRFRAEFFSYEHATTHGEWCGSESANAIAWSLRRGA